MWLSFADPSRPEGDHILGVAIVEVPDDCANVAFAASVAWQRGCNPGGQVFAAPVPAQHGPPPPELDHRLVSDKLELDRLTQQWHGCGLVNLDGEPVKGGAN